MEEKIDRVFTLEREDQSAVLALHGGYPRNIVSGSRKCTIECQMVEKEYRRTRKQLNKHGWRVTHIDGDECYTCEDCGMPIAYNEECGRDEEGIVTCIPCLSKMVVDCEEAESGKTTMAECLKCENMHDCWRD